MITVQLDNEKYFTGSYVKVGSIPNGVKVHELPNNTFGIKATCWKYESDEWIFDEKKYALILEEHEIEKIRKNREEAFKIIDKYQLVLVYNDLTEEQKEELADYRKKWLDAPETKIMPANLDWLI